MRKDILASALRELATQLRSSSGDHPDVQQLLSYTERQTSQQEEALLREHLSHCRDCCQIVLDCETFLRDSAADETVPDDIGAAWEEFRSRLAGVQSFPRARRPAFSFGRSFAALAATLGFACLGLFQYAAQLQRSVRDLSVPRVQVELADLLPDGEQRGLTSDHQGSIRLRSRGNPLVLILSSLDPGGFSDYRVAISTAPPEPGRSIWRSPEIARDPKGNFIIELPGGFLPAGNIEICLFGRRSGGLVQLATYRMHVVYE